MNIERRVRAGAVVVDGDRVLVCGQQELSADPPYRWYHFPGGGIDEGESVEAAVVRELLEETGVSGRCGPELVRVATGGYPHRYFLVDCDDPTIGECTGPELDEVPAENQFRAEWIALADLPALPVWPRAVAEHLAAHLDGASVTVPPPFVEDVRQPWEGTQWRGPSPGRRTLGVHVHDCKVAVFESARVAGARLAVVNVAATRTIETYVWGDHTPPETELVPIDQVEPAWLRTELPKWIAEPDPAEPDRFWVQG